MHVDVVPLNIAILSLSTKSIVKVFSFSVWIIMSIYIDDFIN